LNILYFQLPTRSQTQFTTLNLADWIWAWIWGSYSSLGFYKLELFQKKDSVVDSVCVQTVQTSLCWNTVTSSELSIEQAFGVLMCWMIRGCVREREIVCVCEWDSRNGLLSGGGIWCECGFCWILGDVFCPRGNVSWARWEREQILTVRKAHPNCPTSTQRGPLFREKYQRLNTQIQMCP